VFSMLVILFEVARLLIYFLRASNKAKLSPPIRCHAGTLLFLNPWFRATFEAAFARPRQPLGQDSDVSPGSSAKAPSGSPLKFPRTRRRYRQGAKRAVSFIVGGVRILCRRERRTPLQTALEVH
jgi:hypothetical protein